ncbi:hypothetical protein EJM73_08745 [Clostridium botulinum]|uniref:hypothetical protein n=1 Tax=Clostridium botulinum TaxID=1491 RepID=UPI0013762A75|nr:hypothetical protein [Clostridium botulinum]NCI19711.1 hypothetical protein [Clostridium botulinum]NCI35749.1 hypothetical protein [Clostridium botulinum]NCI71606.1 hypothetical protein [Clostridium botulinum]NDI38798.1 hypothetical protein [Clostridium botulinum]
MDQREKCDICLFRDKDDNCSEILGAMGSNTPCNYIKECEIFQQKIQIERK